MDGVEVVADEVEIGAIPFLLVAVLGREYYIHHRVKPILASVPVENQFQVLTTSYDSKVQRNSLFE